MQVRKKVRSVENLRRRCCGLNARFVESELAVGYISECP
jgi:hypothetical protein